MSSRKKIVRPQTLAEVAAESDSARQFGMNLRDWQHEISRGGVHSRKELAKRIAEPPKLLRDRFEAGDVPDAYLAAYAEWLADKAGIARPEWCGDACRAAVRPWFATPLRGHLLVEAPASFRQRQIFTIPDPVFTPRRGRPRVSAGHKREMARKRQKAYRERIHELLIKARAHGL